MMRSETVYPPKVQELLLGYEAVLDDTRAAVIARYEPLERLSVSELTTVQQDIAQAVEPILAEIVKLRAMGSPVVYLDAAEARAWRGRERGE